MKSEALAISTEKMNGRFYTPEFKDIKKTRHRQ